MVLCHFQEAQMSKASMARHSDPEVPAAGRQQVMGKVAKEVRQTKAPTPLSPSTPHPAARTCAHGAAHKMVSGPGLGCGWSLLHPIRECLHSSQGLGCQGE